MPLASKHASRLKTHLQHQNTARAWCNERAACFKFLMNHNMPHASIKLICLLLGRVIHLTGSGHPSYWVGLSISYWVGSSISYWVGSSFSYWVGSSVSYWVGSSVSYWVGSSVSYWVGSSVSYWVGSSVSYWVGSSVSYWVGSSVSYWVGSSISLGRVIHILLGRVIHLLRVVRRAKCVYIYYWRNGSNVCLPGVHTKMYMVYNSRCMHGVQHSCMRQVHI